VNANLEQSLSKQNPQRVFFHQFPKVDRMTAFNKPLGKPKIVWIQPELWCEG